MIKGKKGNIFLGISIFFLVYVFGVLFLPFIADDIATTRIQLDCTNANIIDGAKLNCLLTDILMPYYILFFLSTSAGFLIGRDT